MPDPDNRPFERPLEDGEHVVFDDAHLVADSSPEPGEPGTGTTDAAGDYAAGDYPGKGPDNSDRRTELEEDLSEAEDALDDICSAQDDNQSAQDEVQQSIDEAGDNAEALDDAAQAAGQCSSALEVERERLEDDLEQLMSMDPLQSPGAQHQVEDNRHEPAKVGDPVQPFSGSFARREVDVRVPCALEDFVIERHYNNQVYTVGILGPKWHLNFEEGLRALRSGKVLRTLPGGTAVVYGFDENVGFTSPEGWTDVLEKRPGGWRIRDGEGGVRLFDRAGRLLEVRDRVGNATKLTYDASHQLVQIEDSCGRVYVFGYNNQGLLASITDPTGNATTYDYAGGRLVAVQPPGADATTGGPELKYHYADHDDPRMRHNLVAVTDHLGTERLRNRYGEPGEAFNRVVRQEMAGGVFEYVYTVGSEGSARRLTMTNPLGHIRSYDFDEEGRQTRVSVWTAGLQPGAPQRYVTEFSYGGTGLVASVISPGGAVTEFTYDESNADFLARTNVIAVRRRPRLGATDAESPLTWYAYGTFNQVTRIVDPLGHVTDFTLDASGNTVRCELPARVIADGSTVRPVVVWQYGARGLLQRVTDPLGLVKTFSYFTDAGRRGLLRRMTTDPGGINAVLECELDALGRVTLERATGKSVLEWRHDRRGRPTETLRGGELTHRRSYDQADQLVMLAERCLEPDGTPASPEWRERHFEYDLNRRLVAVRMRAAGVLLEEIKLTHDVTGQIVLVEGPGTLRQDLSYDERGLTLTNMRATLTPAESRWSYRYSADGQLVELITPNEDVMEQHFDGLGQMRERIDPDGCRTVIEYDLAGRSIRDQRLDADGLRCRMLEREYDPMGGLLMRRLARLDAAGQWQGWVTESWARDSVGQAVRHVAANGAVTEVRYDLVGNEIQRTDAVGNEQHQSWDAAGRLVRSLRVEALGGGATAQIARDNLWTPDGFLARVTDSAGRSEQMYYNSLGDVRRVRRDDDVEVLTDYDALRRVTAVSLRAASGGAAWTERLEYDAQSALVSATDGAGRITRFTRDEQGRVSQVINASGSVAHAFTYDAAGNVATTEDPRGVLCQMYYDGLNRLISCGIRKPASVAGPVKESFSYDACGNLVRAANDFVETTFEFDSLGSLRSSRVAGSEVRRSYLDNGLLDTIEYPSGLRLSVTTDALGRLAGLDAALSPGGSFPGAPPAATLARFGYAGREWRASLALGANTQSAQTHDMLGRPLKLETRSGNTLLHREAELRDQRDRVTLTTREAGSARRYLRDARGMITREERVQGVVDPAALEQLATLSNTVPSPRPASALEHFVSQLQAAGNGAVDYDYDAAGNRTQVVEAGQTTALTINERDEITQWGTHPLAWDAAGNMIDDGAFTYGYDAVNRLSSITDKASGAVIYEAAYDSLGRVIRTVDNGVDHRWTYDGSMAVERAVAGQSTADMVLVWGGKPDELLLIATPGRTCFAHRDLHGNTAFLTEANGTVVERYEYDLWGARQIVDGAGQRLAQSTVGNPFGYLGRPHLPGEVMIDLRARGYHSGLGRFVSVEPSGFVDGLNRYQYGRNDPLTWSDRTGFEPVDEGSSAEATTAWGMAKGVVGGLEGMTGVSVMSGVLVPVLLGGASLTPVGAFALAVGVVITGHGVDSSQAGFRQAFSGTVVDTVTTGVLQDYGLTLEEARMGDASIGVLSGVWGMAKGGVGLAAMMNEGKGMGMGLSLWPAIKRYELGSKSLGVSDEFWKALEAVAPHPLQRAAIIEAGKFTDAAGQTWVIPKGVWQWFLNQSKSVQLFWTGLTPVNDLVVGAGVAGVQAGRDDSASCE